MHRIRKKSITICSILVCLCIQLFRHAVWACIFTTVIFPSFQTDRSGQTVQTQIRLLLKEQSDQGLHCLQFTLILWMHYSNETPSCSTFKVITTNCLGVGIFRYISKHDFTRQKKQSHMYCNVPEFSHRQAWANSENRKFPKYLDIQKICCNHSKIWTMWLYHRIMSPNDADGKAHSVDTDDQTAPLGAVWYCSSRSSLIWVCTVCPGISVQKLRIITVLCYNYCKNPNHADTQKNLLKFKQCSFTIQFNASKRCRWNGKQCRPSSAAYTVCP